jgi:uncharacterized protein (TIGR04255 family)
MPAAAQFTPILPQHAIERCAATAFLTPAVPEKAFERAIDNISPALSSQGFVLQQPVMMGFQFGPGQQLAPIQGPAPHGMPRVFVSSNQTGTLTISPASIGWTSTAYVRWQPFIGEVERFLLPALNSMLDIVSVLAVKLEYWDRFVWTGDWDNFDAAKLLKRDSDLVSVAAARGGKQWHSHAGWFDREGQLRRLTNVNVDVSDMVNAANNGLIQPGVGIYSSLTEQANVFGYGTVDPKTLDDSFVVGRFEIQHLALKDILVHIITDEMANRIGLHPRTSSQ